ncbi:MAG: M20/M25/M40 family metallo-hydrolase [Candidatus Micrarchaeia archaeon]
MEVSKRVVKTLQELIRIDSSKGIQSISDYVQRELEEVGLKVRRDRDGNLLSEIGEGEGFLLNAHLDTVKAEWEGAFSARIVGGRVYGRGASDCKAGVATMIEIARLLEEEKLSNRVVFTFTGNEEDKPLEMNGAYKLARKIKARRGLVLEPTAREDGSIGISVGCRGSYRFRVDVLGKSCHSAHPERGENAIYNAFKFIESFRKMKKPERKILGEEVSATASITQIEAKEGVNVIPGKCSLSIDYRALPEEDEREIVEKLDRICRGSLGKKYRLEKLSGIPGGVYKERSFLEECRKAVESVGCVPRVYFKKTRNDSAVFQKHGGIGCYVMGPGIEEQAHKVNEYCSVDCLMRTTEAVRKVVWRYAVQ